MDSALAKRLIGTGVTLCCFAIAACSNVPSKRLANAPIPEKRPVEGIAFAGSEIGTQGATPEIAAIAVPGRAHISDKTKFSSRAYGVDGSPRVTEQLHVRKGGGRYHVGKPYTIRGRRYVPREDPDYKAVGLASWYGPNFHGRLTANGEIYDQYGLSAAHPTLPLPSYARVTNLENGASILVRINDRGPFARGRIIDLSSRAAQMLGYTKKGVAKVKVEYAGKAQMDGLDEPYLLASYNPGTLDPSLIPANPRGTIQLASADGVPQSGSQRKSLQALDSSKSAGGGRKTFTGHPVDVSGLQPVRSSSLINGYVETRQGGMDNGPFAAVVSEAEPILPPRGGMNQITRIVLGPFASPSEVDRIEAKMTRYGPVARYEAQGGKQFLDLAFAQEDRDRVMAFVGANKLRLHQEHP